MTQHNTKTHNGHKNNSIIFKSYVNMSTNSMNGMGYE